MECCPVCNLDLKLVQNKASHVNSCFENNNSVLRWPKGGAKTIKVWLAPAHSGGSKCKAAFSKFGPDVIEFVGNFDSQFPKVDPCECDLVWFPNPSGGPHVISKECYNVIKEYILKSPNPTFLGTYGTFIYSDYDNTRLLPLFGVKEEMKKSLKTDQIKTNTYEIMDRYQKSSNYWQNTKPGEGEKGHYYTLHIDTNYNHSQFSSSMSWLQGLKEGAEILAATAGFEAVILSYEGPCPEFGTGNKRVRSIYASQMLEYAEDTNTQRLLYNIICELGRPLKWDTENHHRFPLSFRKQVKTILLLSQRDYEGKPFHEEVLFYKFPKEIIHLIIQFLSQM